MILCTAMLLQHLNLLYYSDMIKNAVMNVLAEGRVRTKDIGGKSSTDEYTNAVIKQLSA